MVASMLGNVGSNVDREVMSMGAGMVASLWVFTNRRDNKFSLVTVFSFSGSRMSVGLLLAATSISMAADEQDRAQEVVKDTSVGGGRAFAGMSNRIFVVNSLFHSDNLTLLDGFLQ